MNTASVVRGLIASVINRDSAREKSEDYKPLKPPHTHSNILNSSSKPTANTQGQTETLPHRCRSSTFGMLTLFNKSTEHSSESSFKCHPTPLSPVHLCSVTVQLLQACAVVLIVLLKKLPRAPLMQTRDSFLAFRWSIWSPQLLFLFPLVLIPVSSVPPINSQGPLIWPLPPETISGLKTIQVVMVAICRSSLLPGWTVWSKPAPREPSHHIRPCCGLRCPLLISQQRGRMKVRWPVSPSLIPLPRLLAPASRPSTAPKSE
ncbi:hypothetical protein MHYP_G00027930 [Metynnis hypsauchen]